MSILSDSNWLKALDMKASMALAVLAASTAVYIFSEEGWFYLNTLPGWVRAVAVLVAILSFAIFCAKLWEWVTGLLAERRRQRRARQDEEDQERKKRAAMQEHIEEALGYLDTLSRNVSIGVKH